MKNLTVRRRCKPVIGMRKTAASLMAFLLAAGLSVPVSAADAPPMPTAKEEVVYGILNTDGSVDNIYVVNIFDEGKITDYGSYSEVKNLTTSDPVGQDGDLITIESAADRLYYQGTLESKELPWSIAIAYELDGKAIPSEELAGKSGALRITVSVKRNAKITGNFFTDYALQIGLQLDTKYCDNITASGATVAEAGRKKQMNFTVLPGTEAAFAVTADVHDFRMDAVTINGIRLAMDLAIDSSMLADQTAQLKSAADQLDDGAGALLDGANQLSAGMSDYVAGLDEWRRGVSQLGGGTSQLASGASALNEGLKALAGQGEALMNGAIAIRQSVFDTVNGQLAQQGAGLPVLTPENYVVVLEGIPALTAVKAQLDGIVQFTDGLKQYTGGVSQLSAGAAQLADGAAQLGQSAAAIPGAASELYKAGVTLSGATESLRDGLAAYRTGTAELKAGVSEIDDRVDEEIDKITGRLSGEAEVVSFVSAKNTDVKAIQFVLKTAAIEPVKTKTAAPAQPVRLTFWQKLLKLFGLYKE